MSAGGEAGVLLRVFAPFPPGERKILKICLSNGNFLLEACVKWVILSLRQTMRDTREN